MLGRTWQLPSRGSEGREARRHLLGGLGHDASSRVRKGEPRRRGVQIDAGVHAGKTSLAFLPGTREASKTRFFWGGQSYAVDEEHMCRIDGAHDAYLSE
jgi:hypothetical protein